MNKLLGLPPLASEHGADVDRLIIYLHWVMGILFVGWLIYFFYVLVRFRKTRHPKANYVGVRTHASTYIEAAVAVVEGVLLIGFAVPLWAKAVDQFPAEKDATVIRVMAQQFFLELLVSRQGRSVWEARFAFDWREQSVWLCG